MRALTSFLGVNVCCVDICVLLLRYDTVHGVYDGEVSNDGEHLIVDGVKIKV